MGSYNKLIEGHKEFRKKYFGKEFDDYRQWAPKYQKPEVMFVSCSDSRVNPAILTNSRLGDIFNVSNVANIVPPYKETCNTHHSTSSAIEFAIKNLKVKHIIVMGHSFCGGVSAMYSNDSEKEFDVISSEPNFISPWVNIISRVKDEAQERLPDSTMAEKLRFCERRGVLISIENLMSFPFVKNAVESGELSIHAWYFNISEAALYQYNKDSDKFETVIKEEVA